MQLLEMDVLPEESLVTITNPHGISLPTSPSYAPHTYESALAQISGDAERMREIRRDVALKELCGGVKIDELPQRTIDQLCKVVDKLVCAYPAMLELCKNGKPDALTLAQNSEFAELVEWVEDVAALHEKMVEKDVRELMEDDE